MRQAGITRDCFEENPYELNDPKQKKFMEIMEEGRRRFGYLVFDYPPETQMRRRRSTPY